ncbi:hypothetical protein BJ912DRAFT_994403 [Pholiota molesta]|nr:hypothetical protein BJ912DRAFT_994403 [Pholiota molesta]
MGVNDASLLWICCSFILASWTCQVRLSCASTTCSALAEDTHLLALNYLTARNFVPRPHLIDHTGFHSLWAKPERLAAASGARPVTVLSSTSGTIESIC